MRRPERELKRLWRKLSHRVGVPAIVFPGLLLVARLFLPYVVRDFVNDKLSHIEGFRGHVEKIRINLYRGAYTIINLRVVKTGGRVPVPFITLPEMDLSVEWSELVSGSLVGKVIVNRPQVNFVAGPTEQEQQGGFHKDWKQTLESIAPFTINRFQVNDGSIRFLDPHRQPQVNLYITNLYATATNLTNARMKSGALPAGLVARGETIGKGKLQLELHMNPLAHAPTFKLNASLTNMDLTALNDFLQAYAKFQVTKGQFTLLLNVAAADERYQGYAKPFFFDLAILSPQKEAHENPFQVLWDLVVAAVTRVFRNQPYNQIATVVPISGEFQKGSNIDLWGAIAGILQNAFVEALSPNYVKPAPLPGPVQNRSAPS